MNETLWDKVKETMERGLQKASETTLKAIEAAKERAEIARLKLHISGIKSKISKEFAELGGIVYELHMKQGREDVLEEERIKEIMERVKELEAELAEAQSKLEEASRKG